MINPTIVEHAVRHIKPHTNDIEIIALQKGRYQTDWLYLGIWSPLVIPIYAANFLYQRFNFIRQFCSRILAKILKNGLT